ncbi:MULTISPECIES: SMP-30/gluconolactonase/LRE family protein [unclassified Duganella]|uniref:SMP-30/gluconolactonase/LRE family protein n=1 Tax=unclassified Duganella TaxID=2636909 RepID=UPI000E3554C9|nr:MULTISPECIES: SMP-30/gluconolactonase/LRE family protein [unclassified Duganella]RFP14996.1 SMP-30/gluconolactonase/LRE family protein [Duganella sp. BJB475]RFP31346.1 SMP-30/gluconolactonase/LRE family protein [Duganella sp. BJB476]
MSKHDVQCIWEAGAELGEGPLWVAEQNRLYFVDLKNRMLHALDAGNGQRHSWTMPDYICWLVARRDGDGFMAGLRDGIARVWLEPELRIEYLARPFAAGSAERMNDAKVDSAGRLWAGSMHNTDYEQTIGRLFRLDTDLSLTVADQDYHICNGPAFSLDGATMYHTDSFEGRTYTYPLAADGTLGERRLWRQFGDGEGSPDGMTVDSEGCVWIAQWGGARVCRYSADGALLDTIHVPALHPASCTFGGADLKTLYITTACEGNTPEQLQEFPLTGGLFAVRLDVAGVPAARFG